MKKILYTVIAMSAMYSCIDPDSLLDKENVGDLYEKDVFTNHIYAGRFLADIYFNTIHYNTGGAGYEHAANWNGAWLDCATDNGEARNLESNAQKLNSGNWNALDFPLNSTWEKNYSQIRACNRLLKHCDIIPLIDTEFMPSDKEYMRAQAMFLRAFHYYELLRAFGGVPIIVDVLSVNDPRLMSERTTFDTTVEFIVGECETAADIFAALYDNDPTRYTVNGSNYGRANQGTALALKAKVLTMAASPLFNRAPGDPQYDSGDPDLELWRYPDYDRERWLRAAKACKDVIDLGIYDLHTVKSGTKTAYETFFTLRAPLVGNKSEGIFSVLKGANIEIFYNNLPFDFMTVSGKGTPVCYNLPTHDLVSSYEMSNGMLPDQPGSGFRPLDQFSDRDPRLNSTIWHDGSTFCGIEFETWRRDAVSAKSNGKHYITGYSRTGYFVRKFMDVDLTPYNSGITLPNTYHIMRYADILLLYAEALNEYHDNPNDDLQIEWAINRVRSRAGMPGLTETFANRGWDMTQDNVRKHLYNERRVEFAFEEYRFWDIRRWMIGDSTQREVHELDIVLKEDDINKVYSVRKIENRAWEDRMNMMPLPQSELNKNPNLIQNWGWSAPSIQQ